MSPLVSYSRILARLKALRRRIVLLKVSTGILAALSYLVAGFLVATSLSLAGIVPVGIRVGWWLAILGGTGAIVGPLLWKYVLFPPSPEKVALVVEAKHPHLKNRLIASLQLQQYLTSNREGYSSELIGRTVTQADQLSAAIDLASCVDDSPPKHWVKRVGILALLAVATIFLFPGATNRALSSFSRPLTTVEEPVNYSMTVYPGNAEVIKFDTLIVRANLHGMRLPDRIRFAHRAEGGNWISEDLAGLAFASSSALAGADSVVFSYRLGPLMRDVEYSFSTDRLSSPVYRVKALDRPRVTGIRLSYFFPSYTGLEPLVIDENDGAISALNGTDVEITIRSNRALTAAEMAFDDGTAIPMTIRDRSATGRLRITRDASYHFRLIDTRDNENPYPIEYPIGLLEDAYPRVEILLPGHDADLDDQMAVNLKVAAVDDFGFSQLVLVYRWFSDGQVRAEKRLGLALPQKRTTAVEVDYWWDLEPIGMMPSDVVVYHVEISDNDRVSGPKSSISKTYTLRLPSLDEMIAEIEAQQNENIIDLEEILRAEEKLAEEIEQLHRQMLRADDLDWQTQKQLEAVNARREELTEEFAEVSEEFSKNVAEMEQRKLASAEMLAKLAEARQLFEEVATEEMKEAARQLAQALQELDMNQMADALEEMQLSTEEMIQRLEQTIAYLKKLQAEQKIDQMVKRAEELLKRQQELNKNVDASANNELSPLAENQDGLQDDFNQFAEDLEALEQALSEANIAPQPMIEKFCNSASQCPAPQAMTKAAQSMRRQDKPGSQEAGKNSEQALAEMLSRMQDMQQMISGGMQEEVAAMLREALEQALYLSEHQEELHTSTADLDARSPALRNLAELQADLLAGTQRLGEAMEQIAKKSMCMGGKMGGLNSVRSSMNGAAEALTQQSGTSALAHQKDAMSGLNETAQNLLDGMQNNSGQCKKPGSCSKPGGMIPQMESLAKQQGRLNMQVADLAQSMGQSMSTEDRLMLSRLKGEQQAIRRGIDELQPETDNRRNLLGRLDKLSLEMKKVIEDLEHYEVSNRTLSNMRRIYSRMLDFQHSLHRQDYKEDRRARLGQDVLRASPLETDLDAGISESELGRLLERYLEEGYPKAYETLIKSYYRELLEEQRLPLGPPE